MSFVSCLFCCDCACLVLRVSVCPSCHQSQTSVEATTSRTFNLESYRCLVRCPLLLRPGQKCKMSCLIFQKCSRPPACCRDDVLFSDCLTDIWRTPWENLFQFGRNFHFDSSLNRFDFGCPYERNISGTTRENASKCGANVYMNSHMAWLEFGGQGSRSLWPQYTPLCLVHVLS